MGVWQPIETAPMDGTRIIIFSPKLDGPKEAIAHFIGPANNEYPWREDEGAMQRFDQPTHWMPLPDPPK